MLSPESGVFPLSLGIQVVKSGEDSRLLYLGSCNGVSSFKIERWGFQREGNREFAFLFLFEDAGLIFDLVAIKE